MKTNFYNTINTIFPKFTFLGDLITNPKMAIITIPTTATLSVLVVDFYSVATLLVFAFIADFVTGITASYFIWKENPNRKEKWFFGKGEGFSSDKFKKMFVKLIVYLMTPMAVIKFQESFHIKRFKYEVLSAAEFDIATFILLIFIANEGFSIFHENLPKCGFNLWKSFKKMIGFYKEVKKEINNKTEE